MFTTTVVYNTTQPSHYHTHKAATADDITHNFLLCPLFIKSVVHWKWHRKTSGSGSYSYA